VSYTLGTYQIWWDTDFLGTHMLLDGSAITFPTPSTVHIPEASAKVCNLFQWGFLVPLDGPMMGMRFQLGGLYVPQPGYNYPPCIDFADALPWEWSCQKAHVEFSCSKLLTYLDYSMPQSCTYWNNCPNAVPSSAHRFSGFPDMPQPEAA
jgi:hypothetical protein